VDEELAAKVDRLASRVGRLEEIVKRLYAGLVEGRRDGPSGQERTT
jgi:hypothetical protein